MILIEIAKLGSRGLSGDEENDEAMKLQLAQKYDQCISLESFKEGDLVLRKIDLQRKPDNEGKLAQYWEGPTELSKKSMLPSGFTTQEGVNWVFQNFLKFYKQNLFQINLKFLTKQIRR